jgi:glycosyltransferase involved in cell wall biosynthesis
MVPTVCVLSFNSRDTIERTIASARQVSPEVIVVDSGSTDGTVELATAVGAKVLHHPFENYGLQRNWVIREVPHTYKWQLHLDADERLSDALIEEIKALPEEGEAAGYTIPRYLTFMGRLLRHNLAPTYHMRLFRDGTTECETRHYDQHFICKGTIKPLRHEMIDDIRMSLSEWTRRHNNWSDAEVKEILSRETSGRLNARAFGNALEKKRYLRSVYDSFPLFVRPILLFFYRYFLRGGFLDGKEGLVFCVLQTLWFRFLVDAKLYEARSAQVTQDQAI